MLKCPCMKKERAKKQNQKEEFEVVLNDKNANSFLPQNKYAKKEAKKVEKKAKHVIKERTPKKILKEMKKKTRAPKKSVTVLKWASVALAGALFGYLASNAIRADNYNSSPLTTNPHTTNDVFDKNDNNIEVGDDDQIVFDKMTEQEKTVLAQAFGNLLLQDANSRSNFEIEKIKDVLSVSLLPCNLDDKTNELDKYFLSILFSDDKNTYALNYLTGKDFESTSELSKDRFADFINFLSKECALDSCSVMSEKGETLKGLLNDDPVLFVGDPYFGYIEGGDEHYFVPIYQKDGKGFVYHAWASPLDSYGLDPMDVLCEEVQSDSSSKTFATMEFTPSESLQKIMKIFHEQILSEKSNSEKQASEKQASEKQAADLEKSK